MSSFAARYDYYNDNSSVPIRKTVRLLKLSLIILTTAAVIHAMISLSSIDVRDQNTRTLGYQLRHDIRQTLEAIKDGDLDTSPYDRERLLRPFVRYYELFETSPRYPISMCMIPKVMSSLALGIFCYLRDPKKFKTHGREISKEKWRWSFCGERYVVKNKKYAHHFLAPTRLAFIRHPIDRFLSGFVNKCILKGPYERLEFCFGCKSNLNCFVDELRRELLKIYNLNGVYDSPIGAHLAPLTWYCNFKDNLRNYIFVRHEKGSEGVRHMGAQLYDILKSVGVPTNHRDEINQAVLVGKSPHSTSSSSFRVEAEHELYANKTLLRSVIELYYYDFIIFGYEIPPLGNLREFNKLLNKDEDILGLPAQALQNLIIGNMSC